LVGDCRNPGNPARRPVRPVRRGDCLSQLVLGGRGGGLHGCRQTVSIGAGPSSATVNSGSTRQKPNGLRQEGLIGTLQIRPHDRNPNLWWASSQGDDVACITRPGNGYLAWTTGKATPGHVDFVGKRFDSIDAALEAVARSFS
jgi:hypothetical protein